MTTLAERLEDARAEVALLEHQAAAATCAQLGRHRMESTGGCNCGCDDGQCSVPVNVCKVCGDCDYGDNAEADEVRAQCALRRAA